MDQNRKEIVETILRLARSLESRYKDLADDPLKQEITKAERVDLDEDNEDKLQDLMERFAREKKRRPPSFGRQAAIPIKGTPPPITRDLVALTDFKLNDRVTHVNCPDWGRGDIIHVEPFQVSGELRQKLTILFNVVGRKTLIVSPGMLKRIEAAPKSQPA